MQGWEFALLLFTLSLKIALLKKETWAICSLQRVTWVIHLFFFRANRTFILLLFKNEWFAQIFFIVSPCFQQFLTAFPIFMPKTNRLCNSLLSRTGSIRSRSLFTKKRREQFALGKERIVISLFCSQKTIRTKNQRANSLPRFKNVMAYFRLWVDKA